MKTQNNPPATDRIADLQERKSEIITWMNNSPHPSTFTLYNDYQIRMIQEWSKMEKEIREIREELRKYGVK